MGVMKTWTGWTGAAPEHKAAGASGNRALSPVPSNSAARLQTRPPLENDLTPMTAYRSLDVTFAIRICSFVLLFLCGTARAETPEQWVTLLSRVHGGFGSFLPVGIRIGEDAMKRTGAGPRELSVVFYQAARARPPHALYG